MINVIIKVKGSDPIVYLYFYNSDFSHRYRGVKYTPKKKFNATYQDAYFIGCVLALKRVIEKFPKVGRTNIFSSNQAVMRQMRGIYKINKKTQQNLFKKVKVYENKTEAQVKYKWIPAHNLLPQKLINEVS